MIRRISPTGTASGTARSDPSPASGAPFGDPRDLREDLRLGHQLGLGHLDDEPAGAHPYRHLNTDGEPGALEPGTLDPQHRLVEHVTMQVPESFDAAILAPVPYKEPSAPRT